jgi:DNA-binding MarR family transcriptional regulator
MNSSEQSTLIELMNALRHEVGGDYFREPPAGPLGESISLTEFSVLMLLARDGERTVGQLAVALRRTASATSRLVDRMVRRGALLRREDADDRRARRVGLSPAGRAVLEAYGRKHGEAHARLFQLLSPTERKLIVRALRLLVEKSRALRAKSGARKDNKP